MQEQFLTQFVESFKHIFIENIDALFSLFSKYATGLFFSLAVIEILIVGLLIALSSTTSIYTLLTKVIKISIFFFLVSHFNSVVQVVFDSIKYISVHTLSSADTSVPFSDDSKLADLWNFKNPTNYLTEGLVNGMDSLADYSSDDDTVNQNNQQQKNGNENNDEQMQQNSGGLSLSAWLGFGQFFALALTAALALSNIILFYLSALIALLICPFGQISLTAGFFQSAFSKFISAGLRLLSFIMIFMLFDLIYKHVANAIPDLLLPGGDAGSYGYIDMSSDADSDDDSQNEHLTAVIDFLMAALGLFLCWFIPKEISKKAGSFVIPSLAPETSLSVVTQGAGNNIAPAAPAASLQLYGSQSGASAPTVSPIMPVSSVVSQSGRTTSEATVVTPSVSTPQVNVMGKTGQPVNRAGGAARDNALKQQASFLQQNFSKERAARLRQNFHNTVSKDEK